jgi:hypothetical protein
VFPLDIEERLDDRERRLGARMERIRDLSVAATAGAATAGAATAAAATVGEAPAPEAGRERQVASEPAPDA